MDQGKVADALRDALGGAKSSNSDTDNKHVTINIQGDLNININGNCFNNREAFTKQTHRAGKKRY